MKRYSLILCLILLFPAASHFAQVPTAVGVQILKAEDARRYDDVLRNLLASSNAKVRERAALAAGRIGDDKAIPVLTALLEKDQSESVRVMAAFAIGEIESIKGADAILKTLADPGTPNDVKARAVEAAGKIAAANSKDEKAKTLGVAILEVLKTQADEKTTPDLHVVRLALTAALRARPAGAEEIVRKFLAFHDPDAVCDALNTLARLRAKNANRDARDLLETSLHALVRANAARLLGTAEDKDAFDSLLKAATTDKDSRVRVSAIRSLGSLKDAKAAEKLLDHGEKLLTDYKKSKFANPAEKSELLEISTVLGRLLSNSQDQRAIKFLDEFIKLDNGFSSEISIARLHIAPGNFSARDESKPITNWRQQSTLAQVAAELAGIEPVTDDVKNLKTAAPLLLSDALHGLIENGKSEVKISVNSGPDFLRAFARYKTKDLDQISRQFLTHNDLFIRATTAGILANQPASKENIEALKQAFDYALAKDKDYNDAQLAILDALYKLDKNAVADVAASAVLRSPDFLVRKKSFEILKNEEVRKGLSPTGYSSFAAAAATPIQEVWLYNPKSGTKLGQVLNTDMDYRRALSRKNGSVKAVLTTEKGIFTIDFNPEEAPLTVDNFIRLARSGYFSGLEVHRVVPNFVMQDGDPRGDGNGGPGWSIRCEVNMLNYDRGAVGMALSGKDTGGSQWFVTHSPQPHLDGGYTVFGHVNETDMKVVDSIVRGDKIMSVKIIEANSPQRHRGH